MSAESVSVGGIVIYVSDQEGTELGVGGRIVYGVAGFDIHY
jgi:hypothetical protein